MAPFQFQELEVRKTCHETQNYWMLIDFLENTLKTIGFLLCMPAPEIGFVRLVRIQEKVMTFNEFIIITVILVNSLLFLFFYILSLLSSQIFAGKNILVITHITIVF